MYVSYDTTINGCQPPKCLGTIKCLDMFNYLDLMEYM